jgi:hypothetical protein
MCTSTLSKGDELNHEIDEIGVCSISSYRRTRRWRRSDCQCGDDLDGVDRLDWIDRNEHDTGDWFDRQRIDAHRQVS